MQTLLLILAIVCLLVGIAGAIVPGLPGPPVSWLGLLFYGISATHPFTPTFLIIMAAIALVITVLDYVIPSVFTKKMGGSKWGIWGCNIGLVISIIGLPFGPQGLLGVIVWPFAGAFIGELINEKPAREAFKAAWGAFLGFLSGTLIKTLYGIAAIVFFLLEVF